MITIRHEKKVYIELIFVSYDDYTYWINWTFVLIIRKSNTNLLPWQMCSTSWIYRINMWINCFSAALTIFYAMNAIVTHNEILEQCAGMKIINSISQFSFHFLFWMHTSKWLLALKVVFFAERDIFPGEEITYDYHFNNEDEGKKIPCYCNSKNCRRYMNWMWHMWIIWYVTCLTPMGILTCWTLCSAYDTYKYFFSASQSGKGESKVPRCEQVLCEV